MVASGEVPCMSLGQGLKDLHDKLVPYNWSDKRENRSEISNPLADEYQGKFAQYTAAPEV